MKFTDSGDWFVVALEVSDKKEEKKSVISVVADKEEEFCKGKVISSGEFTDETILFVRKEAKVLGKAFPENFRVVHRNHIITIITEE